MGMIVDGPEGCYSVRPDGTKDYGCATKLTINEKDLYLLENGTLYIAMDSESLNGLSKAIGDIPEEGKTVVLPDPLRGTEMHFQGVKKIEQMPGISDEDCELSIKLSPRPQPKKGLMSRLFGGILGGK